MKRLAVVTRMRGSCCCLLVVCLRERGASGLVVSRQCMWCLLVLAVSAPPLPSQARLGLHGPVVKGSLQ